MAGHPIPRIPSNLAATNVIPGCLVASPKSCFFTASFAIYYGVHVYTLCESPTHVHVHVSEHAHTSHTHCICLGYICTLQLSTYVVQKKCRMKWLDHDWFMDPCQSSYQTHSNCVLTDETAETTRPITNGESSAIFCVGARLGAVIPMMCHWVCTVMWIKKYVCAYAGFHTGVSLIREGTPTICVWRVFPPVWNPGVVHRCMWFTNNSTPTHIQQWHINYANCLSYA